MNKLVLAGMPFRDAYKKVGLSIEAGQFNHEPGIHHTHEGSIGNLGTQAIRQQMDKVIGSFPFEKTKAAINNLLS